jgi:hypothetical protein
MIDRSQHYPSNDRRVCYKIRGEKWGGNFKDEPGSSGVD